MSKFQKIKFDWKKDLIDKLETKEAIINDCLKEISESFFYEFAKDDVAKILRRTTNYKFIVEYSLFDELYPLATEDTREHIRKAVGIKSTFIHLDMDCLEIINKVISRIVNNFKNLFDKRYSGSVVVYQTNLLDNLVHFDDAFSILIAEEESKLEKKDEDEDEFLTAAFLKLKAKAIKKASKKLVKELIKRADELQGYRVCDTKSFVSMI
ncbi:hypothetical protein Suden_0809 [Sulfurimonas denitrificans DSM 1251]|uniref:Uncharacterized protein n=1 Tax=Sulfurimonas denitrificans (strain ATCC 33889 / DSM 1251) TaxID=326298 RepID=Q30SE3_SULDN|nr:hypothetical protein [Sulfurimonas denitrificans]ABB44088.1 hypothetical protein Suden_0809 [Sulfurimonas denitrificans DSM 1251]